MGKSIGQIIRQLRKRENITQEKLAEILNVSFQSVSRWENDLAYPDLSLIPVIAKYFHVTADELFDMNHEEHQKSREQYEMLYKQYRKDGELELCKNCMLEARREFPRDLHIMMNLAETLDLYENGTRKQKEEFAAEKFSNRIFSLCQCVLEESRDAGERCRAIKLLSEYYVKAGNPSEALQLIKEVTDLEHCRERLLEYLLTGDEKMRQLQNNMLAAIDYTADTMVKIAFQKEYGFTDRLTVDEKIFYVKTANQLYHLLMPDGNLQFYHRIVGWNCRRLAELYLLKDDRDQAFEYLLQARQEAVRYDGLTGHRYTACFVDQLEYQPDDYYKCWTGSEQAMLLYRIRELPKDFQEEKRVMELIRELTLATENEKEVTLL